MLQSLCNLKKFTFKFTEISVIYEDQCPCHPKCQIQKVIVARFRERVHSTAGRLQQAGIYLVSVDTAEGPR